MGKGPNMTRLKGGKLRTPKGVARYAYVNSPDNSTYGKGQYRLTLVWDKNDPEFKLFVKKIAALRKLMASEVGISEKDVTLPLKLVDEKFSKGKNGKSGTDDVVGSPMMAFATNSTRKKGNDTVEVSIPVYNARGEEENLQVYHGDIVRAEINISGWSLNGDHGLKGYLNAVQMLKSNWSGGAGSTFSAEEEYISEEGDEDLTDDLDITKFDDESDNLEDDSVEAAPETVTADVDPLDGLL